MLREGGSLLGLAHEEVRHEPGRVYAGEEGIVHKVVKTRVLAALAALGAILEKGAALDLEIGRFNVEHAGNMSALSIGEEPAVKGLVVILKDLGCSGFIHAEVVDRKGKSHRVRARMRLRFEMCRIVMRKSELLMLESLVLQWDESSH